MTVTPAAKLSTDEILRLNREYTFFSWSAQGKINPIVIDHAEGVYFWTPDGKRYPRFQLAADERQHRSRRRRVVDAIAEQADQLAYRRNPVLATEAARRLGEAVPTVTPGDIEQVLLHQRRCRGQRERAQAWPVS